MLTLDRGENAITFRIPSEISLIESVLHGAEAFLKESGAQDTGGPDIVLRELLNNAVVHGNGNEPNSTVVTRIERVGDSRCKIVVEDEGDGFDYHALDMTLPEDPRRIRDRGYTLINAFSDQIEFNDKGNQVTVHLSLEERP